MICDDDIQFGLMHLQETLQCLHFIFTHIFLPLANHYLRRERRSTTKIKMEGFGNGTGIKVRCGRHKDKEIATVTILLHQQLRLMIDVQKLLLNEVVEATPTLHKRGRSIE